jgi:TatD DNase family protein
MNTNSLSCFFDAHCHLQDLRIFNNVEKIICRAKENGVVGFCCCGSTEKDWNDVKQLSYSYKEIIPSFGIHPWYIKEKSDTWEEKLIKYLKEVNNAGVGEIGLDHKLDKSTFSEQEIIFKKQLDIAFEYKRPVTIHCRNAFGSLLEILKFYGKISYGGIIHSYSGPPDLIKKFEDFGLALSFSCSITFPQNKRSRLSASQVSINNLCIETDSPNIKPYECKEDLNEPKNVTLVAKTISSIRNISLAEVAEYTYKNAKRIFLKDKS